MSKIIIAPAYQHDLITKQLLNEKSIVMDVRLMPLDVYLDELIPKNNYFDSYMRDQLDNLADHLEILKPYIHNEMFLKSLKDFIISMYLYDIDITDLNDHTMKDQELILIFKALNDVLPDEVIQYQKLQSLDISFDNVSISRQNYQNNFQEACAEVLLKKGASTHDDSFNNADHISLYYAANKRVEIESIAQYIIKEKLHHDDTLIVTLDESYLPIMQQIFERYHISYHLKQRQLTPTALKLISLIELIISPDYEHLISFLSSNPLNFDNISAMIKLVNYHHMNFDEFLHYHHVEYVDELMFEDDVKNLNELSHQFIESLVPHLDSLKQLQYRDNLQVVQDCFNLIQTHDYPAHELNTIKTTLMNRRDEIKNTRELSTLLRSILQTQKMTDSFNALNITTLNDIYYFRPQHVILCGTTAGNYPHIQSLKGVIDEKYVRNLNFPEKTLRFNKQLEAQKDVLKLASNLTIFYPISTYGGKEIEPSFEIERLKQMHSIQAQRYPIIEVDGKNQHQPVLTPELAQQLFLRNGTLYGSVSSLERYSVCPYAYFIQHGLKLRKKELPILGPAYIGNIFHKILELLIENNTLKENVNLEKLNLLIDKYFKPVLDFKPTQKNQLIKALFKQQLMIVLTHFKDIENDTYFNESQGERKFKGTMNFEHRTIQLLGFIDRLDIKEDYFRIVDYKSSEKKLSEKKFKQGLQLQLITYLLMMNRELNMAPQGAYYMTLNIKNTSVTNASVKYTKPFYIENTPDSYSELVTANNRVNGWHFAQPDDFYKSPDYVSSINKNMSARGGLYNLEAVADVMEEVYISIFDNITGGNIDIQPVDNPCQYCNYRGICQTSRTDSFKELVCEDTKLKGAQ